MRRIEVIREFDRTDRLIEELGRHIAYGSGETGPSEDLTGLLEDYDAPKEALDDLYERRQMLTESLSNNPGQEELEI